MSFLALDKIKIIIMVFSEITWPIKVNFYVEPPSLGGTKFCARNLGRMLNKAVMLTNAQTYFFDRTVGPIFTKIAM